MYLAHVPRTTFMRHHNNNTTSLLHYNCSRVLLVPNLWVTFFQFRRLPPHSGWLLSYIANTSFEGWDLIPQPSCLVWVYLWCLWHLCPLDVYCMYAVNITVSAAYPSLTNPSMISKPQSDDDIFVWCDSFSDKKSDNPLFFLQFHEECTPSIVHTDSSAWLADRLAIGGWLIDINMTTHNDSANKKFKFLSRQPAAATNICPGWLFMRFTFLLMICNWAL